MGVNRDALLALALLAPFHPGDGPVQLVDQFRDVNPSPFMNVEEDDFCKEIKGPHAGREDKLAREEKTSEEGDKGPENPVGDGFDQGNASRFGQGVHGTVRLGSRIEGENIRPIKSFYEKQGVDKPKVKKLKC
jgi:hypothetical protein